MQCSPILVAHFNKADHISRISFVIDGKDVGMGTVASFRYHDTLCIRFLVFFTTHFRNDDTTISAFALIVCGDLTSSLLLFPLTLPPIS